VCKAGWQFNLARWLVVTNSPPVVQVMNVELLLSALEACGVDNARIEIEGGHEIPVLDNSALGWCIEVQVRLWHCFVFRVLGKDRCTTVADCCQTGWLGCFNCCSVQEHSAAPWHGTRNWHLLLLFSLRTQCRGCVIGYNCVSEAEMEVACCLLLQVAGMRPAPIRFVDEVPDGDTAVVRRDVIMPQKAIAVRPNMPRASSLPAALASRPAQSCVV
jgi:hypothetical protein